MTVLRRASPPILYPKESVWLGSQEQEQQHPWSQGAHLVPLPTLMTDVSLSRELGACAEWVQGSSLLLEQPQGLKAQCSVPWLGAPAPAPPASPGSPECVAAEVPEAMSNVKPVVISMPLCCLRSDL